MRQARLPWWSFVLVWGALLLAPPSASAQGDDMPDSDTFAPVRKDMGEALATLDVSRWIPVADFDELPGSVRFSSLLWEELVFVEGFGPHRSPGEVRHSFVLAEAGTFDLLRHEYERDGVAVTATETSFALHVAFRDSAGGEPLARARELATKFLRVPAGTAFQWLDEPARLFTSDPVVTLTTLHTWDLRVDGLARDEGIVLFCYKRHYEYERLIPGSKWIDDEFRNEPSGALFAAARSGRTEPLEPFAARPGWPGELAKAVLGRTTPEGLLEAANSGPAALRPGMIHEAHAFLGIAAERNRDPGAAKTHYERAIAQLPDGETPLARWARTRLAEIKE